MRLFEDGGGEIGDEIADMNHAARIVERLAMHRQARVSGRSECPQHLDEAAVKRDGDDIGPRNHHVPDLHFVQCEHIFQHRALLRRNVDFRRGISERVLNVVANRGAAETEYGAQAIEQTGRPAGARSVRFVRRRAFALAHDRHRRCLARASGS